MKRQFQNIIPIITASPFNVLACGERFGKRWLLKGLKPEYADKKLYLDLLSKEFDIALRLHHPDIVGVMSIERVDPLGLCIVEEWIDGITLDQWLTQQHSSKEKLNTLQELLRAVAHCHDMQVTHRDLKPSNIMITSDGYHVKIIDFGLSDTDSYSSLKGAAGTAHYVAPEVLDRHKTADARSDIYSLGKIMEVMKLPKRYNSIVSKATSINPDDRYPGASLLLEALQHTATSSHRNKMLTIAAVAVAALCVAAFFLGYNFNYNSGTTQLAANQSTEIPGWTLGDYTALSRDTTLTAVNIVEKGFTVFINNPGSINFARNIPESEAVDLGLSVLWAPFNIGASGSHLMAPGAMICAGTRDPCAVFNGYCYGNHSLDSTASFEGTRFDAAHVLWGGRWRLPLKSDFQELIKKCTWKYISNPRTLPGYLVTGPNGNSIFLPLAGFRYEMRFFSVGQTGYYFTASRVNDTDSTGTIPIGTDALILTEDNIFIQAQSTLNGFSIRPVIDKGPHRINEFYNIKRPDE